MDIELKNKIIEDINKTGYLLELFIARKIHARKWRTFINRSYIDPETNKIRETDVFAFKTYEYENVMFNIHLVIETKKHSKPWVVFVNHYDAEITKDFRSFETHLFIDNFSFDIIDTMAFSEKLPRIQVDFIGRNFYEAFKSPNEPSKIYESILAVGKAALYHRDKDLEDYKTYNKGMIDDSDNYDKTKRTYFSIYLPVIILEGVLSIATVNESLDLDFDESKYCPVDLDFSDNDMQDSTYLVDIITKNYIDEYLDKIENWGKSLIEQVQQNKNNR